MEFQQETRRPRLQKNLRESDFQKDLFSMDKALSWYGAAYANKETSGWKPVPECEYVASFSLFAKNHCWGRSLGIFGVRCHGLGKFYRGGCWSTLLYCCLINIPGGYAMRK